VVPAAGWPGDAVPRRGRDPLRRPVPRPARAAAAARLYRYYLQTAQAILLRRAFAGQRLQAPTRLLFGADDFYIPVALLADVEAHGDDLTLDIVSGCSHWMPEERPDLIAAQATALFG
jgi:pimeloyl-ACP methyl ester carboxylesterase